MRLNNSSIYLENVAFYSYHGVAPQEREVGNTYYITLKITADLSKAMESDDVSDTVNYASIYQVLAEEMAIPSNLLEHVCGRIADRLFNEFDTIQEINIKLSKRNPPMGADIDFASVEMDFSKLVF